MEYAIELGSEHGPPLFLGAVDEGVPSAAANAGIGEAAIDPAEPLEGSRHRGFNRGGIADVADAAIDHAGTAGHRRRRVLVLLGVAAPDRDVAASCGERLRDT